MKYLLLCLLLSGCCGGLGCNNYLPYGYQGYYRTAPNVVVNVNTVPTPAVTTTTTTTVSQ